VIDDQVGNTLAAASTLTAEIRAKLNGGGGANKVVAWPLSAERSTCAAVAWARLPHACQRSTVRCAYRTLQSWWGSALRSSVLQRTSATCPSTGAATSTTAG